MSGVVPCFRLLVESDYPFGVLKSVLSLEYGKNVRMGACEVPRYYEKSVEEADRMKDIIWMVS
jgi:hypothetical protein